MFHVIFPYCFKIVNMLCFICEWMNNLYIFLQVIEIMCVLARLQYIRADCVPSFEGSVSPPSEALGLSQLPTLPAVKYLILSQVPIPLQRGLESGPLSPRQWRVESGPHPPGSEGLSQVPPQKWGVESGPPPGSEGLSHIPPLPAVRGWVRSPPPQQWGALWYNWTSDLVSIQFLSKPKFEYNFRIKNIYNHEWTFYAFA